MRLLFFSDLHAHAWPQFSQRLGNGLNSRFQDCLNIIDQVGEVAKEEKADAVWFLGDMYESRTKLDVDVFTETWKRIRNLAQIVPLSILIGNHDEYAKADSIHSIEAFKDIPNVTVYDTPILLTGCQEAKIAAFPHTTDIAGLKNNFSHMGQVDLVLIHQALREGSIGPYGRTIAGELSISELPMDKCRYVFAGDYHSRQFIGPSNRVHYIGSPLQLKFSEVGELKAFTLLDTSDWSIKTIPTKAPRFFLFDTPSAAAAAISAGEVDTGYDFIRIRYSKKSSAEAAEIKQNYPEVQLDQQTENTAHARTGSSVVGSDVELLKEYAMQRNAADAEELVSLGLELLEGE